MTSYTQIYALEKRLYDALADFESVVNDTDFKNIFAAAGKYDIESQKQVDFSRAKHDNLICRLYTYIINQIPRRIALKMLSREFNINEPVYLSRLVNDLYIENKKKKIALNAYAAQMLKRAGVTNKKIAAVLNISSTTAAKYLQYELTVKG